MSIVSVLCDVIVCCSVVIVICVISLRVLNHKGLGLVLIYCLVLYVHMFQYCVCLILFASRLLMQVLL